MLATAFFFTATFLTFSAFLTGLDFAFTFGLIFAFFTAFTGVFAFAAFVALTGLAGLAGFLADLAGLAGLATVLTLAAALAFTCFFTGDAAAFSLGAATGTVAFLDDFF